VGAALAVTTFAHLLPNRPNPEFLELLLGALGIVGLVGATTLWVSRRFAGYLLTLLAACASLTYAVLTLTVGLPGGMRGDKTLAGATALLALFTVLLAVADHRGRVP